MADIIVTKKIRKPRTKKADMIKKKEAEKGVEHIPKKRGRKPKGGKIVKNNTTLTEDVEEKAIEILHLQCKLTDIEYTENSSFDIKYTPNVVKNVEAYTDDNNNYFALDSGDIPDIVYNVIESKESLEVDETTSEIELDSYKKKQKDKRDISKKLKDLEKRFSMNQGDKKSACFWCTCDFSTPPIHIPSLYYKEKYDVYGCFCSPECASAHLFKETIDNNSKFERYQLLNYMYGEVYGYKKEIKQAPNPFYTLDKFYGSLTIQEYRQLLQYERIILVINKPVTKVFPEIHEDNNDFETIYDNKVSLKKKIRPDKKNVIQNAFALSNTT
jgi:hypothetical protein